ncbi:hypothetical protein L7F22_038381 [Adiantum nelumboides]|nr:hypothetical protein [Adiantum nelumboides]
MSGVRSVHDMLMQAARSKKGSAQAGRPPASHVAEAKEKMEGRKDHNGVDVQGTIQDTIGISKKGKEQKVKTKTKASKGKGVVSKEKEKAVVMEVEGREDDAERFQKQEGQGAGMDVDVVNPATDISKETTLLPVAVSEVPSITDCVAHLTKKQLEFDPSDAAFWKKGESVPFVFLAHGFDMISCESGRIAMTDILTNVFRTIITTTPEDLLPIVYLAANRVAPSHHGVELGIGDAAVIKTIAETFGKSEPQVKSQLKALGDLGLVAKACRTNQRLMRKPVALTCAKVLKTFKEIAKETGKSSQENRRNKIKSLLVAAMDCEPQFIVRLAQGNLRIGLAEQTVLVALGHAAVLTETPPVPAAQLPARLEQAALIIKQTYSVLPDFDQIVPALLRVGIDNLRTVCHFTPGIPVGPMLAKATKSVTEILDKFQDNEFTCEYKYDGERAQIHFLDNGSVEIYSRNAECTTGKFLDVAESINRYKKDDVKSFVLDCEIVAYDREADHILPFQVLSTRARKGVTLSSIKVQVCVFAFDLIYLNGKELLQEPLKVRRELMKKLEDELLLYRNGSQWFGSPTASLRETQLEPVSWWEKYGIAAPNLRRIALRVLSQDCSSGPCERNWSTWALFHTKKRNKLSTQQLERLVFCHCNLKLLEQKSCPIEPRQVNPDKIDINKCKEIPDIPQEEQDIYAMLYEETLASAHNTRSQRRASTHTRTPTATNEDDEDFQDSDPASEEDDDEVLEDVVVEEVLADEEDILDDDEEA